MKFLILNTDYPGFLLWFYAQHLGLEDAPYDVQLQARNDGLFGVADFYSSNLRELGQEAYDIHANNEFMQRAWGLEHGVSRSAGTDRSALRDTLQRARHRAAHTPLRLLRHLFRPILRSLEREPAWFYETLRTQIQHYRPDVLLNQSVDGISTCFLEEMKPHVRLLVGQIAAPLPEGEDFRCYDLMLSSLPNLVQHFSRMGLPSELHRLAFEPRVQDRLPNTNQKIPVSFVGSLSPAHKARVQLLGQLCDRSDIGIWGPGIEDFSSGSPIRSHHRGEAWGAAMYQILHDSRLTVNHHIGVAGPYANNMRLFEATGVGTLLITDWKQNLHEMFDVDKEVAAYRTPEECAELVEHYLDHEDERQAIARAGNARTLREHTYYQRMQDLLDIVQRYL